MHLAALLPVSSVIVHYYVSKVEKDSKHLTLWFSVFYKGPKGPEGPNGPKPPRPEAPEDGPGDFAAYLSMN